MTQKFKVGDIVQLKSGGPKMTVNKVTDDGIWCVWFAGAKEARSHFAFDTINPVVLEEPKG